MPYQVWSQDEYKAWQKKDCGDLSTAQLEILGALKKGKEPLLTVAVPFSVNVIIEEGKAGETTENKTQSDQGPVAPGDRAV